MCSSKSMYDDHCAGKKHKRKEKDAKIYNCEACGIFCITAAEQKEHFLTQLHEESMKVREYLEGQQSADSGCEGGEQTGNVLTQHELKEITGSSRSRNHYQTCALCNVQTNSKNSWEGVSSL